MSRKIRNALHRASVVESLETRTMLSNGPQVIGFVPDYEFGQFSKLDLGALTQINYFAVAANGAGDLGSTSSSGYSLSQLQTVVTAAHNAPSRIDVSITIDPGSAFQTIANSTSTTNTFVANVMAFISQYNLDGVNLDYEPGTLTAAEENSWGNLLAALHAQTSAKGLILSEDMQAGQMIVPTNYLSNIDEYVVMDYDLDYNSTAPYSSSISYFTNWANYLVPNGIPKSDIIMAMPFYGRSGTSWNNSQTETYSQIISSYEAANGGAAPSPSLDTLTINGTTWGFNGVTTIENKTTYVLQNGFGGVAMWELGQDSFTGSGYNSTSLLPAINSVVAAASETWDGHVSNAWNTAANWNFGAVPVSTTNVVINNGDVAATTPITVASVTLNGGTLALPEGVSTTKSLSIHSGAVLDLGVSTLVINYGSTPDPISTIQEYLLSGYAAGMWNGVGIMSSAAASNSASYALGYSDSADPGNPAMLTTQTIEVKYTLLGDADLNGIVNGIDFGILASNFNKGITGWDEGDFDYNNIVNGLDFGDLSANFNKGASISEAEAVPAIVMVVPASTPVVASGNDTTNSISKVLSADTSSKSQHVNHSPPIHYRTRR